MTISKPYEPVTVSASFQFELPPHGAPIGWMSDQIDYTYNIRYVQEVKLIQQCLGVDPDGIIGPATRNAARVAFERLELSNRVRRAEITAMERRAMEMTRLAEIQAFCEGEKHHGMATRDILKHIWTIATRDFT